MKRFFQLLFGGFLLIAFWACDTNRVYEKYYPINKTTWSKDSLVLFNIPVTDTVQNHNLYINVRNDINYNYSNLWLFINIEQPGGQAIKDTFEMVLADPAGKWLGHGFGGLKNRQVLYRNNVYFPHSGDYKISIQQGMRDSELKGISDVGLRVEKTH